MRKESINKVKQVMKQLGITALHMQGDNSNYFSDGTERNAIIFDDANELAWALRVNDNFAQPGGAYKITAFDYDYIQFLKKFGVTTVAVSTFNIEDDVINREIEESADKHLNLEILCQRICTKLYLLTLIWLFFLQNHTNRIHIQCSVLAHYLQATRLR